MRLMRSSVPVLSLALVVLAGCGQPPGTPPPSPTEGVAAGDSVDGDWLVERLSAEMPHLNPYTSSDAYAAAIIGLVFDTLLQRDNETLELEPHLAESYEIAEDHLTYTFTLRHGVTFSDGEPLTAEDVKFSFDKLKDPAVDAPHLRNYYQDVTACEIVDERTVRFTCSQPYFRHLLMLGGFEILPEHIYGQGDFNNHPNNRNPIGSGPYVLERWDTGKEIVVVRNENYWNEEKKPRIVRRVYKLITDDNAAFQVLLRQEMDLMNLLPEQWVGRAAKPSFDEKFDKYSYYRPYYNYIGWNARNPLFADKRVRRAMTMLLDRETIRETIYHGLAQTISGNFFIDSPEYNKAIQPWPFDPAKGKTLLDEAGWTDSNGDGLRDKGGTAFQFELLIVNANPVAEQVATVFQEELRRAGIEMTIRPLEWATFLQSVDERRFEAVMLGWSMPPDADPYQVWHSSQAEKGSNYVNFVSEEADRLIEQARTEFDQDKRIEMYRRFHEILHEEQPYSFMFCSKVLLAVDKRFRNVTMYPLGPDTLEWWVPAAVQRYH